MGGTDFKVDTRELEKMAKLFKMAPKQTQKAVNRYIHDEVYNFKKFAVDVIADTYTIRDRKFVEGQGKGQAWEINVPKASAPIDEQIGSISSRRIEEGSKGLFTGWEEPVLGKPLEMRNKFGRGSHREVWSNAREGNSVYGKMLGQFKLRPESDKIPDSFQYGMPIPQYLAMLHKSMEPARVKDQWTYTMFSPKTGRRIKRKVVDYYKEPKRILGKNKVFILEDGPKHPRGLYTFLNGKVKALQKFNEEPVKPKYDKFDWQGISIEQVEQKFTPEYVYEKYIAPMIMDLFGLFGGE